MKKTAKTASAKLYEYEYNGMKFYTEEKMPQGIRIPAGKATFTKKFYPVSGSLAKDLQMDTSDQKDPNDLLEWLTGNPNPRLNEKKSSTEFKVHGATAFDKALEKLVRSLGSKKITNYHGTVGFNLPNDSDLDQVKDWLKKNDKDKNSYIQEGSTLSNIVWDSKHASRLNEVANEIKLASKSKLRDKIIGKIGDILEEEGKSLLWTSDDMLERATTLDSLYGEFNEWFASMTATRQEMKNEYLKGYKEGLKDNSELTPEQIDEEVNNQDEALQRSAFAKIPVFKHLPAKVAKEVSYKWGYWSSIPDTR